MTLTPSGANPATMNENKRRVQVRILPGHGALQLKAMKANIGPSGKLLCL